ncbi:helix-turn-helix domain-containing protein [Geobacter anodireducens]
MSRKTGKKRKQVHYTPDQLKQASRDYAADHAPPRPVSGASRETLEDVNAFLSGVDVPELKPAPVHDGDIPPGNTLLLTVADLCALLQISRTTLFRMEKAGKVPGRLSLGGQVRYHRETVETWLRSQLKG